MSEKVTIIIPTYKRSDKIERALKSAATQTYQNIEIIVVDDNANFPDERKQTAKIVKKFQNARLIQNQTNLGGALSRNEGIKHASGSFIVFLDDDDEFLPEKVEKQLDFMLKNNLDASFSNELIFNEKNEFEYKESHPKFNKKTPLKYHLTEKIIGPQTFMYKTQVLRDIDGFDDVPAGQEYVLMYKTIMGGYKIDYLDMDSVKIYVHSGERISTGTKKLLGEKNLYKIKRKHFDILNFRERQRVRFEWYINCYRFYSRKKSLRKIWYFLVLLFRFPIQTLKTFLHKFHKAFNKKKHKNML